MAGSSSPRCIPSPPPPPPSSSTCFTTDAMSTSSTSSSPCTPPKPPTVTPEPSSKSANPPQRKKLAPGGRHRGRRHRRDHNHNHTGTSAAANDGGDTPKSKTKQRKAKSHSPKPSKSFNNDDAKHDGRKNKSKSKSPKPHHHRHNHKRHNHPPKPSGKFPAAMTVIVARVDLLDGAAAQAAAAAEMARREHPHLILDDDEAMMSSNHSNLGGSSLHEVGLEVMIPPHNGGGRCRSENSNGNGNGNSTFYYCPTLNGGCPPPVLPYHFFDPSLFSPCYPPRTSFGGGSTTSEGESGSEGYCSSPSQYQFHKTVFSSSGESSGESSGTDQAMMNMMARNYSDPIYFYNGDNSVYCDPASPVIGNPILYSNNGAMVGPATEKASKAVAVVRAPSTGVMYTPSPKHKNRRRNLSSGSNSSFDDDVMDHSVPNPHPSSVVHDKYWVQRRRLFSRFDQGIELDSEGWFSVTPEKIADHVAGRVGSLGVELMRQRREMDFEMGLYGWNSESRGIVVLDAFCGCGGNAIAFGKLPPSMVSLVVCVDVDRSKLRKAAHNASLYGIPTDKVVFVECSTLHIMGKCYRNGELVMQQGIEEDRGGCPPSSNFLKRLVPGGGNDSRKVTPEERHAGYRIGGTELLPPYIDAVFMDPPWGGIDYGSFGKNGFDLAKHIKIPVGNSIDNKESSTRDLRLRTLSSSSDDEPKLATKNLKSEKVESSDEEKDFVDGVDLLKMAASATSSRIVVYDLPRNTNKSSVGRAALAAGYRGNIKLEEHFLNGRLKTVSYYLGGDYSSLLH